VIFKTERDSFRVLDQNGQIRLVQPHQISMRRDSSRAIATDSEGHELRINDNVKEVDGEVGFSFIVLMLDPSPLNRVGKEECYILINPSTHFCSTGRLQKTAECSSRVRGRLLL
jgi:hypothetical protein